MNVFAVFVFSLFVALAAVLIGASSAEGKIGAEWLGIAFLIATIFGLAWVASQ